MFQDHAAHTLHSSKVRGATVKAPQAPRSRVPTPSAARWFTVVYRLPSHQRIRSIASWWFIKRISNASVIQTAIPTTLPPPLNPALVVTKPAIWISLFPGGAIDALAIPHLFGHRRFACKEKNRRNAKNCEFHWCAPLMILFYNTLSSSSRINSGPALPTRSERTFAAPAKPDFITLQLLLAIPQPSVHRTEHVGIIVGPDPLLCVGCGLGPHVG
jgi:hypothetical protein